MQLYRLNDVTCVESRREGRVEYRIMKVRYGKLVRNSILVLCPVCGRWGRLVAARRTMYGRKYRVMHSRTGDSARSCTISYSHPCYEDVDRIYGRIRKRGW